MGVGYSFMSHPQNRRKRASVEANVIIHWLSIWGCCVLVCVCEVIGWWFGWVSVISTGFVVGVNKGTLIFVGSCPACVLMNSPTCKVFIVSAHCFPYSLFILLSMLVSLANP